MSTPIVPGTAALICALRPDLSPAQVDATLRDTATDLGPRGPDILYGYGRVNAAAANDAASGAPRSATTSNARVSASGRLLACTHATPTFTIEPPQSDLVQAETLVPSNIAATKKDTASCRDTWPASALANDVVDAASGTANGAMMAKAATPFRDTGFENPNLGGGNQPGDNVQGSYLYAPVGAAWTFNGSAGITGNHNAFTTGNPPAPEGLQAGFLQNAGSASQTITLAAGRYTVSFKAAQRGNWQFGAQVVHVRMDGNAIARYRPPNTSYTTLQTAPFVVANSGSHTITLAGVGGGGGDFTAFVDDVKIAGAASPTTTTLVSSTNPSPLGSLVALTATVTGGLPAGAVRFAENGAAITGCSGIAVVGAGNSRTAVCATNALTAGTHSITARYSGSVANEASSSPRLSQLIRATATCTRVGPTLTITPPQGAGVQAGTTVPFIVSVTNNDSSACPASTFDLTRRVPAGWTAAFVSLALPLAPGTSGSTSLQVASPGGATNGSIPITATATNRSADIFVRSTSAFYVVANSAPPSCTRTNPTLSITPSRSTEVQAGTMVPFKVTVTNADTTGCTVSTFDLSSAMPTGWTSRFVPSALAIAPGASGSATLQVTSPADSLDSSIPVTATATNRSASKFLRTASARYVIANAAIGINVSGAEYSWETYATTSDLDYLKSKGIRLLRVPFAWEKMQPSLNGPLDPAELARMKTFLDAVGARDMSAIIDMHNYARYIVNWASLGNIGTGNERTKGSIIGSTEVPYAAYQDVWTKLAAALKGHSGLAGYDIMNEPNKMPNPTVWPTAAQYAVNGIRSVDLETTIYVEGDHWAGASTWLQYNANLHIVDPANRLVYEAHAYFDDTSGTYKKTYDEYGATPTRGVEQIQPFLTWLKQKNVRGFVGEFGVPQDDPRWITVLDNFIKALVANNVPGAYWQYTYRTPAGVNWWPNPHEVMAVTPSQGWGMPQLEILRRHAQR